MVDLEGWFSNLIEHPLYIPADLEKALKEAC
jgi:hypothetical protein